jgi:hypothetical protein
LAARIAAVISTAAIAVGAIEAPITPGGRAHSEKNKNTRTQLVYTAKWDRHLQWYIRWQ